MKTYAVMVLYKGYPQIIEDFNVYKNAQRRKDELTIEYPILQGYKVEIWWRVIQESCKGE